MNIYSLSKKLNQKYEKDIDTSAGKVGPYYFIIEPTNQQNLIRISFNVLGVDNVLDTLKSQMSHHRSIGRDGIRVDGLQLIIECKVGGLDDAEELATILETVGNTLYNADLKQVDASGSESSNMGVYRIGTKLQIQSGSDVDEISVHAKERFQKSNQSRALAYLQSFGWFMFLSPIYILVSIYEPSVMGFTVFSFAVMIWMFNKSIQSFLKNWSPSKTDLFILLGMYILSLYLINFAQVVVQVTFALFKSGLGGSIFQALGAVIIRTIPISGSILSNSVITLAFAIAFNYHIVRSLIDISSRRDSPVKRSIRRVL